MDTLARIYSEVGPWGLGIVAVAFILLKGKITFEYPRKEKE